MYVYIFMHNDVQYLALTEWYTKGRWLYRQTLLIVYTVYIAYRDTAYELLVTLHGISMTDINQ